MAAEAAVKTFFSSPSFAVVGASSDPSKFGHKIFNWYTQHNLPVTPINARTPSITALAPEHVPAQTQEYTCLPSLSALPSPSSTSVSIVTPPNVTRSVLDEAKKLGVPAVWLQPGTYDDDILQFIKDENNFKAGIGGKGGYGHGGWCVLVDGDAGLAAAGRTEERL